MSTLEPRIHSTTAIAPSTQGSADRGPRDGRAREVSAVAERGHGDRAELSAAARTRMERAEPELAELVDPIGAAEELAEAFGAGAAGEAERVHTAAIIRGARLIR